MISFSLFVQPEQYDRYRGSLFSHVVPQQAGLSTPHCAPIAHDSTAGAPSGTVAGNASDGPPPGAAPDTPTFGQRSLTSMVGGREIAGPSSSADVGSGDAGDSGAACGGSCGTDGTLPGFRVQTAMHPVPPSRGEVGCVPQTGFYPLSDVADPMID